MRIVEGNASRFRLHPFGQENNNGVALRDKLIDLEVLALDNLAGALDKFGKLSSTSPSTCERPNGSGYRMLQIEIIVEQGKESFLLAALKRCIEFFSPGRYWPVRS